MTKHTGSGYYANAIIRRARKAGRCVNWRAAEAGNAPECLRTIEAGALYAEGDVDPYTAGGFAHDRICAGCAAIEATGDAA